MHQQINICLTFFWQWSAYFHGYLATLKKVCQLVRAWNKRMIFYLYKTCLYSKKQAYLFLENYQRTFKVILYFRECNIITRNNDHGWNLITTLAHRNNTNDLKTKGTIFGKKWFTFPICHLSNRFYEVFLHCLLLKFIRHFGNSY